MIYISFFFILSELWHKLYDLLFMRTKHTSVFVSVVLASFQKIEFIIIWSHYGNFLTFNVFGVYALGVSRLGTVKNFWKIQQRLWSFTKYKQSR